MIEGYTLVSAVAAGLAAVGFVLWHVFLVGWDDKDREDISPVIDFYNDDSKDSNGRDSNDYQQTPSPSDNPASV
jgi:hypothetical protein